MRTSHYTLTACLVAGLAVAAAGQTTNKPVLTCASAQGTTTASVLGFVLQQQTAAAAGSQSTGAGAGKASPLGEASVDLGHTVFVEFAADAANGLAFATCTLSGANGITAVFKDVHLDDVKLIDGSAKSSQQATAAAGPIVEVAFSYISVLFSTSTQSSGTIGTLPLGGWNQVTNTPLTGSGASN